MLLAYNSNIVNKSFWMSSFMMKNYQYNDLTNSYVR